MGKKLGSRAGERRIIRLCRHLGVFFIMLIILMVLPFGARADTTSVTLSSFEAVGGYGEVDLVWETATELNNSGFYINRSSSATGDRVRIQVYLPGVDTPQDFIYSTSDGLMNTIYEAYDRNVDDGVTYYYWVESVPNSGSTTFSSPKVATTLTGVTPTLTATPSPTATPTVTTTPSPTITSIGTITPGVSTTTATVTSTATPTLTRAPTLSASFTPGFFLLATTTPVPSNTWTPPPSTPGTQVPTFTATLTSTATLEPLPSIDLLFPLVTDTGTPTPTSPAIQEQSAAELSDPSQNTGMSPDIILLIAVILIIWILLGVFLFFYIRRIGTGL
jgi:hypothetical protein